MQVDFALNIHQVSTLEDKHIAQSFNEVAVDGFGGVLIIQQNGLDDT